MRPSRNYDEWVVEKTLGSGTFGTTKLLRCPTTGERIAVKFIPRGKKIEEMQTYVVREVLNHMQLTSNPNIVGFKEVYLTPAHLCIAMEYVAGGELFDTIVNSGTFSEDVARYFFQQLISGVAFCHSQGVCHRDLKLENSLLDRRIPANAALNLNVLLTFRPQLKICDFGYSKGELDSQPKSKVGTPAYIAPEVLVRRQHEYKGEIADVWSCGVILYVMLVGAYPFEDPDDPDNFRKTMDRITAAKWSLPSDVHLSQGCLDMLRRIFEPDADKRISMAEIQQHPWFKRNLPKSMAAGGGEEGGAPQIRQSRDDVKQIVAEACHVEGEQGGAAAGGEAGKHLVDYEMEDRYMDDYFDGAGGNEDSMMDTGGRGQTQGGRHIDPEYAYELGHY